MIGERGPEAGGHEGCGRREADRAQALDGIGPEIRYAPVLEPAREPVPGDVSRWSVDIRGAWAASMTWVLPVTVWWSWFQVNSATSWSRHMRVSRDSSGGLTSIIWLRSFRLPATTCCHSTAWSLATRKPAQRPHQLPVPRDIDDSVLADDLLLAMPRPPARLCAREAAGGSKRPRCSLFCDVETLVRIGVSLKNPLTIFGL